MPYCTSCGTQARDNARFCTKCGQSIQIIQKTPQDDTAIKRAYFEEKMRGLEPNSTCAYCIYRHAGNVCGLEQSPNYGRTIQHQDACYSFTENPAQLHFVRAMFMEDFADKLDIDLREVAEEFRRATCDGLPADDEMKAKLCIGKALDQWSSGLELPLPQWVALPEIQEVVDTIESALEIDRTGGFGFFDDPKNRCQLRRIDMIYMAKGGILSIEKGRDDCISDEASLAYWEQKLPLCRHLKSSPLLSTLVEAGYAYSRTGKKDKAIECFESVLTAAPVNPFDANGFEAELRERAKAAWRILHEA